MQAEPLGRLLGPARRVLPGVAKAEHEDARVVLGELPQDVSRTQPPADAEHERFAERASGVRGDYAQVGQHIGDGRAVGVDTAVEVPVHQA